MRAQYGSRKKRASAAADSASSSEAEEMAPEAHTRARARPSTSTQKNKGKGRASESPRAAKKGKRRAVEPVEEDEEDESEAEAEAAGGKKGKKAPLSPDVSSPSLLTLSVAGQRDGDWAMREWWLTWWFVGLWRRAQEATLLVTQMGRFILLHDFQNKPIRRDEIVKAGTSAAATFPALCCSCG